MTRIYDSDTADMTPIVEAFLRSGDTQKDLAAASGLSLPTVCRILKGRRVGRRSIVAACGVYGIDPLECWPRKRKAS